MNSRSGVWKRAEPPPDSQMSRRSEGKESTARPPPEFKWDGVTKPPPAAPSRKAGFRRACFGKTRFRRGLALGGLASGMSASGVSASERLN